jgi:hypothetical protein
VAVLCRHIPRPERRGFQIRLDEAHSSIASSTRRVFVCPIIVYTHAEMDAKIAPAKSLALFVFHQFVGTWGIAFLAAFGLTSFVQALTPIGGLGPHSMRLVHWLLTENPFYPVQIATGLYFGWLLSRYFQSKSVLWVWVLPLGILGYAFVVGRVLTPGLRC